MTYKPCRGGAPCLLLLVDDEPKFAAMFKDWVREVAAGTFDTLPAASLEEMAAALSTVKDIDAVILDLGLSTTDGLDTLDRAVTITQYRVPIIVLTGGGVREEEARERGAYALCEKAKIVQTADRESFLKIVRGAIALQRFIDRAFALVEEARQGVSGGEALKKIEEVAAGLKRLATSV